MKVFLKLLKVFAFGFLFLPQQALANEASNYICNSGKDKAGNRLPEPTMEHMRALLPQLQSYIGLHSMLMVAHQCKLDTSRHAALIFRATESMGCALDSRLHAVAVASANHEEKTNYKVALLFKNARSNSIGGVDEVCTAVAQFDPDAFDVMSLKDASAINRLVRDVEAKLHAIWHGEKE